MKKFGLSKKERIKKKKDFEQIYSSGLVTFSKNKKIKILYIFEENSEYPGVKAAFAVSKKAGKAVWRNRVKRLLRESFRLNKKILSEFHSGQNVLLKLVISPSTINQRDNNSIKLSDVMPEVIEAMLNIRSRI